MNCALYGFVTPHIIPPLQLYSDFQELVDSVVANTTNVCCFNATNITVVSRSFQTNEDPVPYIKDVFVSLTVSTSVHTELKTHGGSVVRI